MFKNILVAVIYYIIAIFIMKMYGMEFDLISAIIGMGGVWVVNTINY